MSSNVEIANLALSHLGHGKEISDLTTDRSQEALVCNRFFSTVRDATLRDFSWPFATKYASLALIEEDPNDEWGFSYRYPSDCLMLRKILSGIRNDTRQSKIPYEIARDDSGFIIYTDQEDAKVKYTVKTEDPSFFTPDFVLALSYRLAAYIAPRLTAGDPYKLGDKAMQMYLAEISNAQALSKDEQQEEEEPEAELIRSRV